MYRSYYYYGINTISITYYILLFIYIIIIGYIYISTTYSISVIYLHTITTTIALQYKLAWPRKDFFLASICHAITDPPVTKIRLCG